MYKRMIRVRRQGLLLLALLLLTLTLVLGACGSSATATGTSESSNVTTSQDDSTPTSVQDADKQAQDVMQSLDKSNKDANASGTPATEEEATRP